MTIGHYQPRYYSFEAYQVPEKGEAISQRAIEWLDDADTPYKVRNDGTIDVVTGYGMQIQVGRTAKPGDYIYKIDRTLKVETRERFRRKYRLNVNPPRNTWTP